MSNKEPSSFCTLGSYPVHKEMLGLLTSISIHHPGAKIYCVSDSKTKKFILNFLKNIDLKIYWKLLLNKYSNHNYMRIKKQNFQKEFLSYKTNAMDFALVNEKDTMFLDTDIVVLSKIKGVVESKKIGLSPHYNNRYISKTFGYFNTGCVWTKDKGFPKLWKKEIVHSKYVDQACMDEIYNRYKSNIFLFPPNYNFTWIRTLHTKKNVNIKKKITTKNDQILFMNKDIKFVHTHFPQCSNMHFYKRFNRLIIQKLFKASKIYELICIYVMINKSWFLKNDIFSFIISKKLNLKNILFDKTYSNLNYIQKKYLIFKLFRQTIFLTKKLK